MAPKDIPVLQGAPRSFAGQNRSGMGQPQRAPRSMAGPTQQDGTPTTQLEQAPPKFSQGGPRPMQTRSPTGTGPTASGMEQSLGALADKLHPTED